MASRPVYTRAQARFVAQSLYRALLDRSADEQSIRPAVNEIEDGRVRAQVDSIVRSPEYPAAGRAERGAARPRSC